MAKEATRATAATALPPQASSRNFCSGTPVDFRGGQGSRLGKELVGYGYVEDNLGYADYNHGKDAGRRNSGYSLKYS